MVKLVRIVATVTKVEQKLNVIELIFGRGFKWTANDRPGHEPSRLEPRGERLELTRAQDKKARAWGNIGPTWKL